LVSIQHASLRAQGLAQSGFADVARAHTL
jgi:hypothetical protein